MTRRRWRQASWCSARLAAIPAGSVTSTPSITRSVVPTSQSTLSSVTPSGSTSTSTSGLMARARSACTSALFRPMSPMSAAWRLRLLSS